MNRRSAPPGAAALVGSLRGLGYSPPTAIADLIDNSIAAGARTVTIKVVWAGADSWISIADDGLGMDEAELEAAMRLGVRSPSDERSGDDLGRFGMGLKTASFSMARRLTVASLREGQPIKCLRWDLVELERNPEHGWFIIEGAEPGSEERLGDLHKSASGTMVLLEDLDRLVTPGFTADDLHAALDEIEAHLAITFQRYIEGSHPRLRILLGARAIRPIDPFMSGHPGKALADPLTRIPWRHSVSIQCNVLPHPDQLSPEDDRIAAGPSGWVSGQGFYIYRNDRLIVAGSWLGLGAGRRWTRDDAHRLARIRLDITNDADADWELDILKSRARPPVELRRILMRYAERTRSRARLVFANRGRAMLAQGGSEAVEPAWVAHRTSAGTRYRISREHEAVRTLLEMSPELHPQVETMLQLLEETVPVQRIWLDTAEDRETPLTGFDKRPDSDVLAPLNTMFAALLRRGFSPADARRRLARTEPFDRYPELVAALQDGENIQKEKA